MTDDRQIDTYIDSLRTHLGPIGLAEREEIVREIAAHIRDSAEGANGGVESVLARLGPAAELAAQYRDGMLIRQASRSISPLVLLRGALRLATKGVFGILVFFLGMFGYLIGGGLVLTALLKPIFPANTGMWLIDGHLVAFGTQFFAPQTPAHEVLGLLNYILLGLSLGSLILLLTTFTIRNSLRLSRHWQAKL